MKRLLIFVLLLTPFSSFDRAAGKTKSPAKVAQKNEAAEDDLSGDDTSASTSASEIPDADKWMASWKSDQADPSKWGAMMWRIVFVKKFNKKTGEPVLFNFTPKKFEALGFITTVYAKAFQLFKNINQRPEAIKGDRSDEKNESSSKDKKGEDLSYITNLINTSGADTVGVANSPNWQFFQMVESKPTKIFEIPAPSPTDPSSIHKSLVKSLGYDAVILDRKGNHFLVASMRNITKASIQALILTDTKDKYILKKVKKQGAGLVELVSPAKKPYGVFKLIVGGDSGNNILPGTKLIMESDKSGDKSADEGTETTEDKPTPKPTRKKK